MEHMKDFSKKLIDKNKNLTLELATKQKELDIWDEREKKIEVDVRKFQETIDKLSQINRELKESLENSNLEYSNLKELNDSVNKERVCVVKKNKELEVKLHSLSLSLSEFQS